MASGVRAACCSKACAMVTACGRASVPEVPRSGIFSSNKAILQKKKFDPSAEERLDSFFWSVDDGLALHVEAGVEDHLASGGFADGVEEAMEVGIVLTRDSLQARGAVDVGDGGKRGAMFRAHVYNRDHVWHLRAGGDVEPAMRFFDGACRSKGAEGFAHFDHGVDAVAHSGVAW